MKKIFNLARKLSHHIFILNRTNHIHHRQDKMQVVYPFITVCLIFIKTKDEFSFICRNIVLHFFDRKCNICLCYIRFSKYEVIISTGALRYSGYSPVRLSERYVVRFPIPPAQYDRQACELHILTTSTHKSSIIS